MPQTYTLGFWNLGVRTLAGSRVPWVTATMEALLAPTVWQPGSLAYQVADAVAQELGLIFDALDFLVDQAFASTASLGLPLYEAALGIATDLTLPLQQRQQTVLSALRTGGSPTLGAYQRIVQVLDNSDNIQIAADPLANALYVLFLNITGEPPNVAALQNAIALQTAGRLSITYQHHYLTWSAMAGTAKTWTQIAADALPWSTLIVTPVGSL